jgi:hypothetical protein
MTIFRCDEVRLTIDLSSRVGLGIVFLGLAVFCVYAVTAGAGFLGVIGACVWIGAWLYYATLEVVISPEVVVIRRFWRSIWQARRSTVSAEIARGGNINTHRCLRLTSEAEARPFDMLQSLFGKNALQQAQLMLRIQ